MTDNLKNLFQGYAPSSVGALYTVPSNRQTIVREIRVVNTDTVPQTITLYNNGTSGASIIRGVTTLQAQETMEVECYITMAAADTIAALASTASKLAVNIYGDEIS